MASVTALPPGPRDSPLRQLRRDASRPERFLERKFGPHEWFPFGGGDRLCTGMAFALTEMKVVLATLLRTHELARPSGAATHRVRRGVLIAPSDGVEVVAARRTVSSAAGA